jgi:hypothetical protein
MLNILLQWLEKHIWPWMVIAKLRRDLENRVAKLQERSDALTKAYADLARMNREFVDGYNRHFNEWISKANQLFGERMFDERERPLMRRFYEDGYSYREAIELLREAFGYGQYSRTPSKYRR